MLAAVHFFKTGLHPFREVKVMKIDYDYIWTDKKRTLFGLPLSFTRYILTEKKFITRTGFFTVQEEEFDLYKVYDKKLVLTMGQRMFGCGTVIIYVRNNDIPVTEVKSITAPREFMKLLDEYIEKARDQYNIRGRDLYGTPMPHDHHDGDFFMDNNE